MYGGGGTQKCTILARNLILFHEACNQILHQHTYSSQHLHHIPYFYALENISSNIKYTPMNYENNSQSMNITHLLPIQLDQEKFLQLLLWWQQCRHPWVILWPWHEPVYLQLAGTQHWEALLCLSAYWSCKFNNVTNILWK